MRRAALFFAVWGGLIAIRAKAQVPAPPADSDLAGIVSSISTERIQRSIYVLASFKTRHTLSDAQPSGDGVGAAAAWIRAEFNRASAAAGGRLQIETDGFSPPGGPAPRAEPVSIVNISATLVGERPDSIGRTYVICAHYDSLAGSGSDANEAAPGADCDASGMAALLELARSFSNYNFPATIVFLAVTGGEEGGWGAEHWARKAAAQGLDLAGLIDLDCVGNTRYADGGSDRASVRLFCGGENDSRAAEWARAIAETAARCAPDPAVRVVFRDDAYRGRGDHLTFLRRGWPAVRLTEAVPSSHGGADDRTDYVDFGYVAEVARVTGATLAVIARAPAAPREAQAGPAADGRGTLVRWRPDPAAAGAASRIVWRDTTAPFWQHALDVPAGADRGRVPGVAADDAVFGVESVDAAGRCSPAVLARLEAGAP
jgi:hypothetical protein